MYDFIWVSCRQLFW